MSTAPAFWIVLAGILVIAFVLFAAWIMSKRKAQSVRLQQRFGREYGRTVDALGGRAKAESELKARERRVENLTITALAPPETARFNQAWSALQGRFVDNPKGVVVQADQLIRELMIKQGYPMGDFEHRAADISVDHPALVDTYRAAQAIAVRDQSGQANTEELRNAVVQYRTLFDELLGVREAKQEVLAAAELPVHS